MKETLLNVGDVVEVTTERLAYGGDAVARYDGLAIFIPLAAPGERLAVRLTELKKNFARAVIDRILEPSPLRREPLCRYFGECGGCQLQHLTYETQVESKLRFVRDALERIGRIDWPGEINIRRGAEFGYRSRAQVKIDRTNRRVGFRRAGSNSVCYVVSCPILVPELDKALGSLRSAIATTGDPGLANVSSIEMAAGELDASFEPAIAGLSGSVLKRTVRDAEYSFSPSTFFQATPGLLGDLIDEAMSDVSGALAFDLYAGVGLFAVQLARRFNRVIGVEADRIASKFALENVNANRLSNVEIQTAAVEAWLTTCLKKKAQTPDLVLLDPPRTGAAAAISHICELQPPRVTYVSCDPVTLARDLRALLDGGYELVSISAIDLFPQTYHVETVAALKRR